MASSAVSVLADVADEHLLGALREAGLSVTRAPLLAAAREHDAVLLSAANATELAALATRPDLPAAAFDSAVVVYAPEPHDAHEAALLGIGVEAIVTRAAALPRGIRHAVLRKQHERAGRVAYATDLATGLPHQAQLIEHMTQLVALREREPAPMVLLVLRIEGLAAAAARLGSEAANVLRRKVAVRLRSGLRASDVVAAMGADAFGVLLGHLEAKGDGERVAAKLAQAVKQPFQVAGHPCALNAAVGLAVFPDHGKDAKTLLQRASAQAGGLAVGGGAVQGALAGRSAGSAGAANDEA